MLPQTLQFLGPGSSGDYVSVVQKVLNLYLPRGNTPLNPDGIFGPLTAAAVKNFQSRHQLVADGIVGPLTRAKLFPLGSFQSVCCMTAPPQVTDRPSAARLGFTVAGKLPGRIGPAAITPAAQASPAGQTLRLASSTSFPLAPMTFGSGMTVDQLPGFPEPFPFPDLLPKLPSVQFPSLLPPLTLPTFFHKKVQLIAGAQRAVPKLTLFGPAPKTNPVVDTFLFTVRGVWRIAKGGQFQAGAALGLPISQPISDPKNTTFQVFAQGLTPDLLIAQHSWVHLFLIGKASVTVAKDGSSTSAALSPQFKASFDLTKETKDGTGSTVSFSVVGGPQLGGTVQNGSLTVSVTPFVTTAGVTLALP